MAATPAPAGEGPVEESLPTNDECATCHDSKDLVKRSADGQAKSLFVTQEELKGSVHAGLECVDCHVGVKELPHPRGEPVPPSKCDKCHARKVQEYAGGVHGSGGVRRGREPLPCSACHGPPHRVLPSGSPSSPTHRNKVPETCGGCHGELKMVVEPVARSLRKPFFAYQNSVHGKAVANGSTKAAVCTDCHKSHDILPPSDSRSTIFKFNVPGTCGGCHDKVFKEYSDSVHGEASALGMTRSPVCTDCHGIHSIKSHLDPSSSVASQVIARTTCPQCHESLSLNSELGLPAERVQSYLESYHGLASQRGSKVVANCASCHGVHNIYPSTDPRSTVHPGKLSDTCGTCHPGAGENFTRGKIHEMRSETSSLGAVAIDWARRFYMGMIVMTVGAMLIHNLLDLRRKADPRHRTLPMAHLVAERLNRNERVQHAILASSFILLVLTGFALRFPNSWLSNIFWGETLRRFLHRAAAVAMVLLGAYHMLYMVATRQGRRALREMRPGLHDFHEAVETVSFNLGFRKERPESPHFGYPEKMEYWAVIWGTAIMAITGFMLWFKITATQSLGLPLWIVDLAHVVHYYEAWLATLAIVVWHFYFVIFDPAVYPMNWAWLKGWIRGRPPTEGPPPA